MCAGSDTSCPFALNVAQDYTGPGADYAYSPVTGLNYIMNCGVVGAGTVICTGGDDAYVQFQQGRNHGEARPVGRDLAVLRAD